MAYQSLDTLIREVLKKDAERDEVWESGEEELNLTEEELPGEEPQASWYE